MIFFLRAQCENTLRHILIIFVINVRKDETNGGALSADDALRSALNIAPPNTINPCSFFFSHPRPHACLSPVLYSRVFFSEAIFNPWKDECCARRRGKMESLYWNRHQFSPESCYKL